MRTIALISLAALSGCGAPAVPPPDPNQCPLAHDNNKDCDGDGYTPAQGDCNDKDPTIYPGALEACDFKDNDCNGVIDDPCDDDKDGWAIKASGSLPGGDCNDEDPLINPGAYELIGNFIDDDCDGKIDNPYPPCTEGAPTDPVSFAAAMDLCSSSDPNAIQIGRGQWLKAATFNGDSDPRSHAIRTDYGNYHPRNGGDLVVLSTGIAADEDDPGYASPQPGTAFDNNVVNPFPQVNKTACYSGPDEDYVHDLVEYRLVLRVPTNARGLYFSFMFLSAEYPENVGTPYNDKFLALLDSKAFKGNIAFDKNGQPISVDTAFFAACDTAKVCNGSKQNICIHAAQELAGTGYELPDGNGQRIGAGTSWLTATGPVYPGETATLRFILFDEGDHLNDSTVLIDGFQWRISGCCPGPP